MSTSQLDNASPHLAQNLILPENVILLFQSAYSPDVNPIERLWRSLKDKLSWLTVETLDELRREMDVVLNSLTAEGIASLIRYDFIRTYARTILRDGFLSCWIR